MTETPNDALLSALRASKLLAILRGVPAAQAPRLIGELLSAGIKLFEVALSDEHGLAALRAVRGAFGAELYLGAGTVTTAERAAAAQAAGASFLVTPTVVPAVAAAARERGLGLLMGAMTPSEIAQTFELGSAAAKVFPAGSLGPDYFRHLLGPFPDWPLLAVGGVNAGNLGRYLGAGALGAGIGGALTGTDWQAPDWSALRQEAQQLRAVLEEQ